MPTPPSLQALLTLLVALLCQPGTRALGAHLVPTRGCPSCRQEGGPPRALREPGGGETGTAVLALGEPCGVYTLGCARGLRCVPRPGEKSPLQALLQGRGVCARPGRNKTGHNPVLKNLTTAVLPGGSSVPPARSPDGRSAELAPCRRLLNSVLESLKLTVIQSPKDIYIPNCDTRGFYRKNQCRSSKGTRRGECWCVDELGQPLTSPDRGDASLQCDGE
ncbi:insulin-like growth factor-binding protein 6b [Lepisosteus oculatus]|uniref:Insulin-like growth factor binding protein 6b n=1 Tax=Lepisosteus oculatus TaxID=7918 RepID=W5M8T4_LEPOC|nr:PREDICTED: insulin-like growth factor-binding protein 6 [Lepisosteus oculatus]